LLLSVQKYIFSEEKPAFSCRKLIPSNQKLPISPQKQVLNGPKGPQAPLKHPFFAFSKNTCLKIE
jgi:hypothetical protein